MWSTLWRENQNRRYSEKTENNPRLSRCRDDETTCRAEKRTTKTAKPLRSNTQSQHQQTNITKNAETQNTPHTCPVMSIGLSGSAGSASVQRMSAANRDTCEHKGANDCEELLINANHRSGEQQHISYRKNYGRVHPKTKQTKSNERHRTQITVQQHERNIKPSQQN